MTKEYRVVNTMKRGLFRCYGEFRLDAVSRAVQAGVDDYLYPTRLDSRPLGMQGDDSTWTAEQITAEDLTALQQLLQARDGPKTVFSNSQQERQI